MQICDLSVEGFRCLAEIKQVPVLRQTVLTGQNEGGKTALLDALAFLLKGTALSERDLTYLGEGEVEDADAQARVAFSIVQHSHEMIRPLGHQIAATERVLVVPERLRALDVDRGFTRERDARGR